jgi:DNA-binding NtrC family response regulator
MDDDLLALESLESYLKQAGYAIVTASSARDAIERARETSCDLALLDMKMPEMDGFQVAAMLRQIQPDLRVVIFTGYASLETEARAAQLDFYEYLPKSNWYDLLLPTVERQAARIAEFTHEWENAAKLYNQAFEYMKRARGLSVETQRLQELAECAQRIGEEGVADHS